MPSVIVAILWKLIYQPDAGILNAILRDLGIIDSNIDWLGSFTLALPAVIVVGVWAGMPQTTIALLAGLQNTPVELHEAAAIDGAGTWERFKNVTWPAIKPVVIAITSLDFVWNFNSFGLVYVLTEGGPGGRTLLPMLFAYQRAFGNGEFGYAAALGNAMVIVIMAIMVRLPPAADAGGELMRTSVPVRVAQYAALAGFVVFLGFPLLWLFSTAFKSPAELTKLDPTLFPTDWTLANFATALAAEPAAAGAAQLPRSWPSPPRSSPR